MKTLSEIIDQHSFFAGLPKSDRDLIAGCARIAAFRPDENLFKAGEPADNFFLIRHGLVALELHAPGKGLIRLETLSEGEVMGWSWLFPPHRWQFDARAIEKVSVISFDGRCLREKCETDPRLGYNIMKRFAQVLVRRFSDTRLQLIDVYGKQGT